MTESLVNAEDNWEYLALFSHFGGDSALIHRKSFKLCSTVEARKYLWMAEDESLMRSHGPVTDYTRTLSGSGILLAKGIGKESKVVHQRDGI